MTSAGSLDILHRGFPAKIGTFAKDGDPPEIVLVAGTRHRSSVSEHTRSKERTTGPRADPGISESDRRAGSREPSKFPQSARTVNIRELTGCRGMGRLDWDCRVTGGKGDEMSSDVSDHPSARSFGAPFATLTVPVLFASANDPTGYLGAGGRPTWASTAFFSPTTLATRLPRGSRPPSAGTARPSGRRVVFAVASPSQSREVAERDCQIVSRRGAGTGVFFQKQNPFS